MRAIVDTHVFLWWFIEDPQLTETSRSILLDVDNELFLSAASAYEIAAKATRGRLTLPEPPHTYVQSRLAAGPFRALEISLEHAVRAGALPVIHRDPFDRMIIAQAQIEAMPLITADRTISRYDVETIW